MVTEVVQISDVQKKTAKRILKVNYCTSQDNEQGQPRINVNA